MLFMGSYPIDFKMREGGKQENPDELTPAIWKMTGITRFRDDCTGEQTKEEELLHISESNCHYISRGNLVYDILVT